MSIIDVSRIKSEGLAWTKDDHEALVRFIHELEIGYQRLIEMRVAEALAVSEGVKETA